MNALVANLDVGAVRETLFVNQLKASGHGVVAPQQGDFVVDGKFLFEIGGRGNKIPLWLFAVTVLRRVRIFTVTGCPRGSVADGADGQT